MLNAGKIRLHELVDALPADQVEAAKEALECLAKTEWGPVVQAFFLNPPFTVEDLDRLEEGRAAIAEGGTDRWEQAIWNVVIYCGAACLLLFGVMMVIGIPVQLIVYATGFLAQFEEAISPFWHWLIRGMLIPLYGIGFCLLIRWEADSGPLIRQLITRKRRR